MTTTLVLPPRGKAAKLVDERSLPGHLRCSSCEQPVFNSFQSNHGCRLCQTCVEALPAQERVPCPGKTEACRDKDENTDICQASCFPDMASRREIGKLQVSCPNKQDGCADQFCWRDVEAHLSSCDFEKVQCDLCGERRLKRELADHKKSECRQRRVECSGCRAMVVSGLMNTEHLNLMSTSCCPVFVASCPHCSEGQLKRPDYLRHLMECRQKPTACKFAHLGCPVVDAAARLETHYYDAVDKHLEMVDKRLVAAASGSSAGGASVPADATATAPPVPLEGAVREAAELERKALSIFAVFKRMQPNVAGWASITIELEELMKAFGGSNGFKTVLKTMDDKLRHLEALERASSGASAAAAGTVVSESARFLERSKKIELRFDALELTSYDGCLAWKVAGVAAKRREAKSGSTASLFSPPFFSKRYGYMFRVRLFLNGHDSGEGTYVSVQLVLMQSEYDDILDWPFLADVTFRLVNPRSRSEDVISKATLDAQKPSSAEDLSMNVSVSKFAKISVVEEKFIRNDCMYVEAEVEPRPAETSRRGRRR